MRERNNVLSAMGEKRLLDANEVCLYVGLGLNRGVEFAKAIGAMRKIGRRTLFDKVVIDKYLDEQAKEAE